MTGTKLFSRLISVALALVLALTLLPGAARAATDVKYIDENGVERTVASATDVAAGDTDWGTTGTTSWYVVTGDVTINGTVTVSGDVHLILTDGCSLTVDAAIPYRAGVLVQGAGNSLTIYGQAQGTGMLTANGTTGSAGIGGNFYGSGVTVVTINGGTVVAGGYYCVGIGSGGRGNDAVVTINGGTVRATGGSIGDAGIGGGIAGSGTVVINGGMVTATGGASAAGIGGGLGTLEGSGNGGNGGSAMVTINGGTVNTNGICGGAGGEGATNGGNGGSATVTITGGTVTANRIGGGNGGRGPYNNGNDGNASVAITGGSVKTTSIGGNFNGSNEPVYLTTVTLGGVSTATAVSALTTSTNYSYGMQDVKTDNEGKLYLYLPLDTKTTRATAGGRAYAGEVLTSDNAASSQGTLSRVYANDSPGYLHQTLQDPATGVSLTGYFEPGARLTVTPKALHAEGTCAACDAIRERQRAGDALALYDIAVSGAYSGNLEVRLPVGTQYNGQSVTILHCANGRLETYTAVVQDSRAVFSVNSLSPFAAFLQEGLLGIPKTGDNSGTGLWLALIGAALALAGLAIWRLGSYSWIASEHTIASAR